MFKAQYHEREPADPGRRPAVQPLFPAAAARRGRRGRPTSELVDLAGQFLYRDLCSPLGRAADLARAGLSAPPWQSRGLFYQTFGLYHLAWPRHALLGEAGRRLCQRLVQRWMSKDSKPLREAVQTWVQEHWAQHELGSEQLIGRLRDACQELLRKPPEDAFAHVVELLARCSVQVAGRQEGPAARPDAAGRRGGAGGVGRAARQAASPNATLETSGALVLRLREASEALVHDWGQKLSEMSVQLIEEPQFRLAGAEEAVRQVVASIEQILQHHEPLAHDLAAKAVEAYGRLQAFAAAKAGAGLGSRGRPPRCWSCCGLIPSGVSRASFCSRRRRRC